MAFPGPGPARFVRCQRIQVTRRTPEQGQRAAAAGVVPHARRDRPAGTGDPAHLAQASYRIGHEMDDQLRQRDIKGAVSEGQLLGRRPPDIDSRQALPRRGGERLGRFHCAHRARPQPPDQLGRQHARPAADIQRALAAGHSGQVSEQHRERLGVPAHEAHIGVRADIKSHPVQPTERHAGRPRPARSRPPARPPPRPAAWAGRTASRRARAPRACFSPPYRPLAAGSVTGTIPPPSTRKSPAPRPGHR